MKLLSPAYNFVSAQRQIAAGADEIYIGGDSDVFKCFSFHGRARFNSQMEKLGPEFLELRDIITYAHEHQVTVMYAANAFLIAEDPEGTNEFEKAFLDYIETGIKAGADSIIVADLGAAMIIRGRGIKHHLTASTFLETTNIGQLGLLEELGFNRVVLSYQLTLAEIETLAKLSNLEIEVFGHFGCSFYDGYCNFNHRLPGASGAPGYGVGIPCCNSYQLIKDGEVYSEGRLLFATLFCSICALARLKTAGVHTVKLVGRDMGLEQNANVTRVYAEIFKQLNSEKDPSGFDLERFRRENLPERWRKSFCAAKSCKYMENKITRSFI